MTKTEIASQLKNFFETEFPNPGIELSETTNLLAEWFIDSLAIVNTTLFMESNFDIELSRADINGVNFENITSLTNLIAGRLAEKS